MRYLLVVLLLLIGLVIGFLLAQHPVNTHRKVYIQPVKVEPVQQPKKDDDDDNGLNWYVNPANPIGLFSSNWMSD